MRRLVLAVVSMLAFAPAAARAGSPVFVDSLAPQVFQYAPAIHSGLRRQAFAPARHDSIGGFERDVLVGSLYGLESACRTHLFPKDSEPGSPWLTWRSLARVDVDGTAWFLAALSCVDNLCRFIHGPTEILLHDRVALLAVGRDRSRVLLLPPEAATIGDAGNVVVDSVASIRGDGYLVVQVRRRVSSDHPCYDGGDVVATDEHYFLVLRGDSLAQAFMMVPREEWDSHDDVDGDLETDRTASVSVSPTSVRMAYQVEERQHAPDGDESKTRTTITSRGVVRLVYDKRSGRFRRME